MSGPDEMVARIDAVRFRPARRDAYKAWDVDQLLADVVDALRAGTPIGPVITGASLSPVRFFLEGYAIADVDPFLAQLVAEGVHVVGKAQPDPAAAGGARPDLARKIDNARFTPVRLREGYDMGQVDELLERLRKGVLQAQDPATFLPGVRLDRVRLREGYDPAEVDRFLKDLVSAWRVSG